ncbi:MAG: hypothetical protein ACOYXB_10000 [Bacteroidota bacterium]
MKLTLLLFMVLFSIKTSAQIKNYMFIGMDRELLQDTSNWATNGLFEGVQIAYSWRQLEPEKDNYDFSLIKEDLTLLEKYGKKLFIQIQDVSFQMKWNFAPLYLLNDTIYHGGANKQYRFATYEEKEYSDLGWVVRRWDKEVQKRLHKLYAALGKEFDGIVEGLNTEETAVTFGNGPLHPAGFDYERYKDAFIENIIALKTSFPTSTVMVYANFMPGGYLPYGDTTLLKAVYIEAWKNNIAVGGPDLFPYKKEQMQNSYQFIKLSYTRVPTALAVQDGNYDYINPLTARPVRASDIYLFAQNELHLSYIFWGTEQPYFNQETIPFLRTLKHK